MKGYPLFSELDSELLFSVNKDSPNQDNCQGKRETSGEHGIRRLDHLEQLMHLEVLEEGSFDSL